MNYNDEGFIMPSIDQAKCIDCGACQRVCPAIAPDYSNDTAPDIFGFAAEKKVLRKSSSGGAFTLLAEETLRLGGTVFGAAYTEDFLVRHRAVNSSEDLDLLRRSKYVQSDQEDCYSRTRQLLEGGLPVLYTGTPCQIAGLKGFLGKDYDRLITCEVICHGIPSPKFHLEHLKWVAGGESVASVEMRNCKEWKTCYSVTLENGEVTGSKGPKDLYIKAFLSHLIMRRSCHDCPFARLPRQADITIGDLWDAGKLGLGSPYEKKSSIVLINSDKGRAYWKKVRENMSEDTYVTDLTGTDLSALNHNITRPSADIDMTLRDAFYRNIKDMPFEEAVIKTMFGYDTGLILHMGNNYGSVATGYALYKAISQLGLHPVMLDSLVPPKGALGKNFIRKHMDHSSRFLEPGDYRAADILCRNFVLGSDQSLNWEFRHNLKHLEYLLMSFTSPEKRRISYAASFGSPRDSIEDQNLRRAYSVMLNRFDSFSVREDYAVEMCRKLFGCTAALTADPVFLLSKEDWLALSEYGKTPQEGYLLAYILDQTPEKEALIRSQASKYGLRLLIITDASSYHGEEVPPSAEDWISLFAHADRVITDSFHGSCFSLIFEKPFIAVKARQTGRFDSLASVLGLSSEERSSLFLDQSSGIDPDGSYFNVCNYAVLGQSVTEYSERSRAWLKDALTRERSSADVSVHNNAPASLLMNYMRLLKEELSIKKILSEGSILSVRGIKIDVEKADSGQAPTLPHKLSDKSDTALLTGKGRKKETSGFSVLPRDGESCDFTFEKPGGGEISIQISSRGLRDMDGELHPAFILCTGLVVNGLELLDEPCFISAESPERFSYTARDKEPVTAHIEWSKDVSMNHKKAVQTAEQPKQLFGKLKKLFH